MSPKFMRRKIEGEEIWLDLEGGQFYGVNEAGSTLLDAWAAGERTPEGLTRRLLEAYEVAPEEARRAVDAFLVDARARGFLD
jgi:hypothetical protein